MKIKMTSVFVKDPAQAFKFYTDILGFRKLMFEPEAQLAIVVSPEDPEGTALLLEPSDNTAAKTYREAMYEQGLPVLVLDTEDIDKEYHRLSDLGVMFKQTPTETGWGTIALFDDTCGNWIQIHQD
jgi:predicted enzyme related to lactoylglutathione lyase